MAFYMCARESAKQISQVCREARKNSQKEEVKIMADVNVTTQAQEPQTTEPVTTQAQEPQATEPVTTQPTVEELMAQLASERAEKEKYKNASDKASSEAANYKKQLRSKQTAEEAEAEAKAEAERLQKEKYEEMSKELDHIKAVSAYKSISTEDAVEKLIDAVADGDHSAIAAIIQKEIKAAVAVKEAEWMKSRPPINTGGGDNAISKEQFNKMKYQERVEFKSKNPELYKKYTE